MKSTKALQIFEASFPHFLSFVVDPTNPSQEQAVHDFHR